MRTRLLRVSTPLVFAVALGAFMAGCSIPIPQAETDPTKFYVLSAPAAKAATAQPDNAAAPVVHLREVELASYLRVRPMIVRHGENQVEFREFARWGEPLDLGIARVLREELLARGAASAVVPPGLRAPRAAATRELCVRVLACEGTADGAVNFRAAWELVATGGEKPEILGRGDCAPSGLRWDGKTEAQLAARLSEAVAGLAAEIATALKK